MPDPNGFLIQFLDGPLAFRSGMDTVAGPAMGILNVDKLDFPWPLPDLLAVAENGDMVALWNAVTGVPKPDGATAQFFYRKVSESKLPPIPDDGTAVIRGAVYRQSLIHLGAP